MDQRLSEVREKNRLDNTFTINYCGRTAAHRYENRMIKLVGIL